MTSRGEAASTLPDQFVLRSERPRALAWIIAFSRSKPVGAFAAVVLLILISVAIFAPLLAPFNPNENHSADRLVSPGGKYLLGTDQFGRDVLSRILYGARISVQVGAISTLVAVLIAGTLGITTAYFGGIWDYLVGRLVDLVQSLPALVLLITLLAAVGRSLYSVALVLGLTSGIVGSRVIRGATLSIAAQPFVEVARSIGCTPLRVLYQHLLINVFPIIIVLATINIGGVIVAEAALSFLGYGVPPPNPSWGGMMSREGRQYMVRAPWLFIAPTTALALVVFSANMFGDALRDRLDPRLRGG